MLVGYTPGLMLRRGHPEEARAEVVGHRPRGRLPRRVPAGTRRRPRHRPRRARHQHLERTAHP
eukprot:1179307-Prorocentrum_minimum.AAC.2